MRLKNLGKRAQGEGIRALITRESTLARKGYTNFSKEAVPLST